MNRMHKFFDEQRGIPHDRTYDFALRRLCVAKEDSWCGILPSNFSADYNPEPPIFSAKFANCDGYRHILAIANEDGKIALQDTTKRNYEAEEKALNAPQCHYNAVFDLEWAPGQMRFVSASGDHTARLWQIEGADIRSVRVFNGHTRSVKTAAFRKKDHSVFATGGRDGAIIIWDTRAKLNLDLTPRADNFICSGHAGGPGTPVSQRKRSRTPKLASGATSSSITGLVFQDENTLISAGAGDGVIKVWDLRRNYTAYKKDPLPKHSLPYRGTSTFKGFTNLLLDEAGARLFANCMDNTIYSYNMISYSPNPLARYKGLMNSTFYIKSCLSPDNKYLLSGSSDEKAYIWNLDYPDEPLVSLSGHTVEVTCVAWGSTHDQPIVTCSDDARHKIWRIGPERISDADRHQHYRGHAHDERTFGHKAESASHYGPAKRYNLRELESTPRSLKRLVEQNERTPNSTEKVTTKRSFMEMMGAVHADDCDVVDRETKRSKGFESRGRRLFSPSTSVVAGCSSAASTPSMRCLGVQLSSIPENCNMTISCTMESDQENTGHHRRTLMSALCQRQLCPCPMLSPDYMMTTATTTTPTSPLTERPLEKNHERPSSMFEGRSSSSSPPPPPPLPPSSSPSTASVIFSPTTDLPNYVLDGDAPHLSLMSPKRQLRSKVDWLTKIRKQKLLSSCRGVAVLNEKFNSDDDSSACLKDDHHGDDDDHQHRHRHRALLSSNISDSDGDGGGAAVRTPPRRRTSHSGSIAHIKSTTPTTTTTTTSNQHHHHHHHQRLNNCTRRRNSDTTILRFFAVQQPPRDDAAHVGHLVEERHNMTSTACSTDAV